MANAIPVGAVLKEVEQSSPQSAVEPVAPVIVEATPAKPVVKAPKSVTVSPGGATVIDY